MKIQARIENLPVLIKHLHEQIDGLQLDNAAVYHLELILEEVCVNIIEHGYQDREGSIEMQCSIRDDQLCLEIKDTAPAFNPIAAPADVNEQQDAQSAKIGGLGLVFLQKFSDHLEYKRVEDMNLLTIWKKL